MANDPSPAMFNKTDGLAEGSAGIILLVGRILLGWLFLKTGWDHILNPAGLVGYLTFLGAWAPVPMAWVALIGELVIGVGLVLGVGTRYVALIGFIWMIIATWLAHRYWLYPAPVAGQPALAGSPGNQFAHLLKNLAVMGGLLFVFVQGAGKISVDAKMK